jgi:hypothetical protein
MSTLNDTPVANNTESEMQPNNEELVESPVPVSVGGRRRRRNLRKSCRGKNKFSKKYNKKSCKKSRRSYKMSRRKNNILGW